MLIKRFTFPAASGILHDLCFGFLKNSCIRTYINVVIIYKSVN